MLVSLLLQTLHDLHIPQFHNSQGLGYLGSCTVLNMSRDSKLVISSPHAHDPIGFRV